MIEPLRIAFDVDCSAEHAFDNTQDSQLILLKTPSEPLPAAISRSA